VAYVIPTEEMALAEQFRMRKSAIDQGKARAAELWKMSQGNLAVRHAHYVNDFLTPAAPAGGVVGLSGWLSQPFAAAAAWYNVFADAAGGAVNPVCPTNQVWVFWGVSVLTVAGPDPATALQFRIGTAANLRSQFDLEVLYSKNIADGYFSQPVTYESPEICQVLVQARAAILVGCRVRLACFIIEPLQTTVI